jgi:hypothetical protein
MSDTSWSRLSQSPGNYASAMWLMQDGSVLVNLYNSKQLMVLHTDGAGSYEDRTPMGRGILQATFYSKSGPLLPPSCLTAGSSHAGANTAGLE